MTVRLTCSLVFTALAAASVDAPGGPAPRIVQRAIAISRHVTQASLLPVQRAMARATDINRVSLATDTHRKTQATDRQGKTQTRNTQATDRHRETLATDEHRKTLTGVGAPVGATGTVAGVASVERPAMMQVDERFALPSRPAPAFSLLFAAVPPAPLTQVRLHIPIAPRSDRPSALVPMYASFATLQALDYHSTTRALSSGIGREANPLARSIVKNRPAFVAAKAVATVAVVAATERMWKKHPARAVVFMAAANTAMAVVVAHNYRVK